MVELWVNDLLKHVCCKFFSHNYYCIKFRCDMAWVYEIKLHEALSPDLELVYFFAMIKVKLTKQTIMVQPLKHAGNLCNSPIGLSILHDIESNMCCTKISGLDSISCSIESPIGLLQRLPACFKG